MRTSRACFPLKYGGVGESGALTPKTAARRRNDLRDVFGDEEQNGRGARLSASGLGRARVGKGCCATAGWGRQGRRERDGAAAPSRGTGPGIGPRARKGKVGRRDSAWILNGDLNSFFLLRKYQKIK